MKCIASLFLATAMGCIAGQSHQKLSTELKQSSTQPTIQVIVQWQESAGNDTGSKIASLGGVVVSEFTNLHSGIYNIPASALSDLESDSQIKFISVDRKLHKKALSASVTANTINAPAAWIAGFNGSGIGVAVLDSGITKDDNLGASDHNLVYSEDFTVPAVGSNGEDAHKLHSYGVDWFGHGQHIAGIIASNGKASNCGDCKQEIAGIAYGANLINLKVLDTNGEGTDSAVIAAIDRAISLKNTYNIRVMNLSLGRAIFESYTVDPLCQAVEAAWKAGIVVVVSAGNNGRDNSFGNDGYGTIGAPGNDPYVITVGAMRSLNTPTRSDDLIASYSSKGPTTIDHIVKPDIVAPGNQIISLLAPHSVLPLQEPGNMALLSSLQFNAEPPAAIPPQPAYDPTSGQEPPNAKQGHGYSSKYFVLSGTSMAAAVVSGSVADLLQANPRLTPDQVKMLLMQTASKTFPTMSTVVDSTSGQSYTSYYDLFTVGAGYLDLQAALASVLAVPNGFNAMSPAAVYDATTGQVTLAYDPSSVFVNRVMWGASTVSSDRVLWGASTVSTNRVMWGADSIWSNSELSGNRVLWGASSVWGNSSNADDANRVLWGAGAIWSNRVLWGASATEANDALAITGDN